MAVLKKMYFDILSEVALFTKTAVVLTPVFYACVLYLLWYLLQCFMCVLYLMCYLVFFVCIIFAVLLIPVFCVLYLLCYLFQCFVYYICCATYSSVLCVYYSYCATYSSVLCLYCICCDTYSSALCVQSEFFITVNAITEYSTSDKNFVGTDISLLKLLRVNGKNAYRHRQ